MSKVLKIKKKNLVKFVNYMMSDERIQNYRAISENGLLDRLSQVSDADLSRLKVENSKSNKPKKKFPELVVVEGF